MSSKKNSPKNKKQKTFCQALVCKENLVRDLVILIFVIGVSAIVLMWQFQQD